MKIIYTGENYENVKNTCFLAGPTPRKKEVKSWRGEAIELFKKYEFDGTLYIPEFKEKSYYDSDTGVNEMEWDQRLLEQSEIVMFWIPRGKDMLGLSTNVEFGYLLNKGNIIYGRPNDAVRCEFLDYLYKQKLNKTPEETLEDTVKQTIKVLKRTR